MINKSPNKKYEIVVVGGGMVGATFALALSKILESDCPPILIVEAANAENQDKSAPSYDARSTALSFGSRKILENTGIWEDLNEVVEPINEIQISDKGHFGSTRLSCKEQNVDALGYVIENSDLGAVLSARLESSLAIDFLSSGEIKKVSPTQEGMRLIIGHVGQSYQVDAKLMVLADGGRSPICQQLGIQQFRKSYEQRAVIANVSLQKPHKNIAFERFTPDGPFAMLPLRTFNDQNRCSMVCVVNEQESEEIMQMTKKEVLRTLQEKFGSRLGKITHIGERYDFPLNLSIAKEQVRPGLALLGNVAHTLHPVAGQGMNLALRDIHVLVNTLYRGIKKQINPGDMNLLQGYIDEQLFDQGKTISFTDNLVGLFSSDEARSIIGRKLGLLSLELFPMLRKSFAAEAMGIIRK